MAAAEAIEALLDAARYGDLEDVHAVLDGGVDVDVADEFGRTGTHEDKRMGAEGGGAGGGGGKGGWRARGMQVGGGGGRGGVGGGRPVGGAGR